MEEYNRSDMILQAGEAYQLPPGTETVSFGKKRDPVPMHFVIHWEGSYSVLRARLSSVKASPLSYRLFYCLADDLRYPYGNVVPYDAAVLAHRHSVDKKYVYIALAHLRQAGVVRRIRKNLARLDPWLVWAGKMSQHKDACLAWEEGKDEVQYYEMREGVV